MQAPFYENKGIMTDIERFIEKLPKAELHLHLEGTLEAELKLKLSHRNKIPLKQTSIEEIKESYNFHDLASFLEVYYEGVELLLHEQDFYDLCYQYLRKAASQNVVYAEMFFDPQLHTRRGISFETVIKGLIRARDDAMRDFHIYSQLIMCFIREMSFESAEETLNASLPYKSEIIGIGLDSNEENNPPIKFLKVFQRARQLGYRLTCHCDLHQKNTTTHIRQALEDIGVERIDHGINILDDPELIKLALERNIPFTVCPFSNEIVYPGKAQPEIRIMLDTGLKVTINSDDPAYMHCFYITENFNLAQKGASLTKKELVQICRNSFEAAWISEEKRNHYLEALNSFASAYD